MPECLAATGSTDTSLIALGAVLLVAIGVAVVWRSGRVRHGVLGLLAIGALVAVGTLGAPAPAQAADDCSPAAASATATPTPTPTPAVTVAGVWAGQIPQSYGIVVTITDDGTTAPAVGEYPGLCGFTWAQTARTETTITFVETVDDAACVDQGEITLTPVGSPVTSIGYHYVYPSVPEWNESMTLTPHSED
ncbi:hypothetical protein H4J02_00790 [Protaetiibacter sp. SSC-01]|uniref:hypothetical protein n=1 Tax=Protaetiibacter sp. SSC-01 TaxID=2759943 RepID=UPI0016568EE3|nr:hypothetical protein [Protaetiibacter sp. SSC-01]QNO37622.1 hypothetical protein H4J02_00790 [Protaetiibacter sp. SSC-01]